MYHFAVNRFLQIVNAFVRSAMRFLQWQNAVRIRIVRCGTVGKRDRSRDISCLGALDLAHLLDIFGFSYVGFCLSALAVGGRLTKR